MEEGRTLDSREQQQPRMLATFPPGGGHHHHEQQPQHHQQADSIINLRTDRYRNNRTRKKEKKLKNREGSRKI
jgi:hypothetical protein